MGRRAARDGDGLSLSETWGVSAGLRTDRAGEFRVEFDSHVTPRSTARGSVKLRREGISRSLCTDCATWDKIAWRLTNARNRLIFEMSRLVMYRDRLTAGEVAENGLKTEPRVASG